MPAVSRSSVSRRAVVAGLAASVACSIETHAADRTLYVKPHGSGDGSSWRAAASLQNISRLVAALGGGGEILLAADQGEYAIGEGFDIDAGGSEHRPVRLRGVSRAGAPMAAVLRGNRRGRYVGDEGFRLLRGADHLYFSHLDFRDVGNGCFHVGAPIASLTVEDCAFDNIYRFLENTANEHERDASLTEFALRRCSGGRVERGFVRIRYTSSNGVIEDCRAQGRANRGGAIPVGCALDDRASNISYRRCVMENFQQWRGLEYWNGDGFSDEGGNSNIRYEDCQARSSTDGGFDCKSNNVVLANCVSEGNKRNFRIWGDRPTLTNCTSRNPVMRGNPLQQGDVCHIWIGGEDARVSISDLTVEDRDATPIFEFDEDSSIVELSGSSLHTPRENWGHVRITRQGAQVIVQSD